MTNLELATAALLLFIIPATVVLTVGLTLGTWPLAWMGGFFVFLLGTGIAQVIGLGSPLEEEGD